MKYIISFLLTLFLVFSVSANSIVFPWDAKTQILIDSKLESVYQKLETRYQSQYPVILKNLITRVKSLENSPKYTPSTQKLIHYIRQHLEHELSSFQSISQTESISSDIPQTAEYKAFIAAGGYNLSLTGDNNPSYFSITDGWQDYEKKQEFLTRFKKVFNSNYDMSSSDKLLPSEMVFNMPREQIQKLTQNIDASSGMSMMTNWGIIGGYTVDGRVIATSDFSQMNQAGPVFNEMKYHHLINGEIKIGSEKYNDYKRDMWQMENRSPKTSTFYVDLEPLQLGKTLEAKLEARQTLTHEEMVKAWTTALELEGLDDRFIIKKTISDWVKYGIYDTKEGRFENGSLWSPTTGGKLGANFVNPKLGVNSYLFWRY